MASQRYLQGLMLTVFLAAMLNVSCSRSRNERGRWPPTGIASVDSLMREEGRRATGTDTPMAGYDDLRLAMRREALRYPDDPLVQSRAAFMEFVMIDESKVHRDSMMSFVRKQKSCLDSLRHSYDWHVWTAMEVELEPDMYRRYVSIRDNIGYFRNANDDYERARALIQMGNLMFDYGDSAQAINYNTQAAELFNSLGDKRHYLTCRLNIANNLPSEQALKIYREIMEDSVGRRLGTLQLLARQNYFVHTGEIEYLDSALSIAEKPSYFSPDKFGHLVELPMLLALKGNYCDFSENNPSLGKEYILAGLKAVGQRNIPSRYVPHMYAALGAAYYHLHQPDSAAMCLFRSLEWRDSIERDLQTARVADADARTRISLAEREVRNRLSRWIWTLSAAVIVIAMGLILFWLNHKRREAVKKCRELVIEQKLTRSLQSVVTQSMVIDENRKFIDEITAEIDTLRRRGDIDSASAGALVRAMKEHKDNEKTHRILLDTRKELEAEYLESLRREFPSLTEGQLKLASLIAIGAESPQICRILGISLPSLHKSRYRLRTRLGLKTEQRLEEFLRSRNSPIERAAGGDISR